MKDIENIEMVDIFEDSIVVGDVEIENGVETVDTDIHISEVLVDKTFLSFENNKSFVVEVKQ